MEQINLDITAVRTEVENVQFTFYNDEDVRSRSVCEITSPVALDGLGTPLPHGLYDPRMGPTDDRSPPCITCGCLFHNCPGHAGHIELCVPTYHPLLFQRLLTMLKVKCYNCHRFRLAQQVIERFKIKFELLDQGRTKEALELDEDIADALSKARLESGSLSTKVSEIAQIVGQTRDQILREKRRPEGYDKNVCETSAERRLKRELVKEFIANCNKSRKCDHCGAHSPQIRHDASSKLFQQPLPIASRRANIAEGIVLKSALSTPDPRDDGYDSDDTQEEEVPTGMQEDNSQGAAQYMHALEVEKQAQLTWLSEPYICDCLFGGGKDGWRIFFVRSVCVPPSRFRPPMVLGTMTVEHAQNFYLNKMLTLNDRIRELVTQSDDDKAQTRAYTQWIELQTTVNCFMDSSKDPSASAASNAPPGIKQLLEKKEGIFRKHMMGKRVNYACRSVISPDPYVGTNEIGIPRVFAETLTYPTPVTALNVAEMRELVKRGKNQYPGACWVEFPDGRRVTLDKMDAHKREAIAARMLAICKNGGPPVTVGRQLRNGDMMLVNRQPTLHKPGIMAHYVRILHSPTQKTIRMHYANCNTYNADFDGDEMNCHFPQSDLARAEAKFIAATDLQFIVPTDGSPLRGLIQDHVDSGVKLTGKDTYLEKWEYQQLLFAALTALPGLEVIRSDMDMELVPPAIRKPRELWTGKQVITTLLNHLRKGNDSDGKFTELPGISTERKTKTPGTAFGEEQEEHLVLIRDGELLRGVLDKAAFGATDFSLIHAVYESYGPNKAGLLLNAFGRLFTAHLQYYSGHSCRMEDLVLTPEADSERRNLVQRSYNMGARAAKAWADSEGGKVQIESVRDKPDADKPLKPHEAAATAAKIGTLLSGSEGPTNFANLDSYMQSQINPLASEIIKACLPNGLAVPFPKNTFGLMVTTGAKGSTVNQSQVSCALGQQALEGRRVPRMSSGRTLPSFQPYEPLPRADGFIADRFLTGVRPQEYYFHCMAGREGLVDTAVKTSRSGYLQRCLVKHLEELKVCYDHTVRNGESGVVQFLYGEDGLDPTKAPYLDCTPKSFEYMARNQKALTRNNPSLPNADLQLAAGDSSRLKDLENNAPNLLEKGSFVRARKLRQGSRWSRGLLCRGWFDAIITKKHHNGEFDLEYIKDKSRMKNVPVEVDFGRSGSGTTPASTVCTIIMAATPDPILGTPDRASGQYRVGSSGSCVSEKVAGAAMDAIKYNSKVRSANESTGGTREDFTKLVASKYGSALCAPGEAVGSIAAQSVGEPSTQMTLNTFHLAGSGANVTLGIPRLREIIMTASKTLKTPTMSVPLHSTVSDKEALKLTRFFTRLTLIEVIASQNGITVREELRKDETGNWLRAYYVIFKLHPAERIKEAFGLSLEDIARVISSTFANKLKDVVTRELRKASADSGEGGTVDLGFEGSGAMLSPQQPQQRQAKKKKKQSVEIEDDSDDEDVEEEVGEEDGVMGARLGHQKEMESYGNMDDDDEQVAAGEAKESEALFENDDDSSTEEAAAAATAPTNDDDDDNGNNDFSGWDGGDGFVQVDKDQNSILMRPMLVPPSARPLLMVGLVEQAAAATLVSARKDITEAYTNEEDGRGTCLQTAGCNFKEFWMLDNVDHNKLASNDIWAIHQAYGVEAARNNIVEQIRSVFGAYGIEVDPRHLSLIADYMTYEGGYKAMNRGGMEEISSAFLQMSFETTAAFMTNAALAGRKEYLKSPSANIVLGQPMKHGTGAFDLLANY